MNDTVAPKDVDQCWPTMLERLAKSLKAGTTGKLKVLFNRKTESMVHFMLT